MLYLYYVVANIEAKKSFSSNVFEVVMTSLTLTVSTIHKADG